MEATLTIGQLGREVGLNPRTIRYYEGIDLLPPPVRAGNGYRLYGRADVARLQFIRRARALNFSLDEIREIQAFRERAEAPCLYVLERIDRQLAAIDRRIEELRHLRRDLSQVQVKAANLPTDDVAGKNCVCHVIQNYTLTNP
ncbi:MAG: heavy metal-responsive transcriptional regulator [Anaerolineae bacterium]